MTAFDTGYWIGVTIVVVIAIVIGTIVYITDKIRAKRKWDHD